MPYNVIGTITLVSVITISIVAFILGDLGKGAQYYDCSIAEFHPDYPIEVKEKCRELRLQRKVIDT